MALQGLSDFREATLPAVGQMIEDQRCYLYVTKADSNVPTGVLLIE